METEAEVGVVLVQESLEAHEEGRGKKASSPRTSGGSMTLLTPGFSTSRVCEN